MSCELPGRRNAFVGLAPLLPLHWNFDNNDFEHDDNDDFLVVIDTGSIFTAVMILVVIDKNKPRDSDLPEDKRRWTSAGNCEEDADMQCRVSLNKYKCKYK